jgi:hypothetical protein
MFAIIAAFLLWALFAYAIPFTTLALLLPPQGQWTNPQWHWFYAKPALLTAFFGSLVMWSSKLPRQLVPILAPAIGLVVPVIVSIWVYQRLTDEGQAWFFVPMLPQVVFSPLAGLVVGICVWRVRMKREQST